MRHLRRIYQTLSPSYRACSLLFFVTFSPSLVVVSYLVDAVSLLRCFLPGRSFVSFAQHQSRIIHSLISLPGQKIHSLLNICKIHLLLNFLLQDEGRLNLLPDLVGPAAGCSRKSLFPCIRLTSKAHVDGSVIGVKASNTRPAPTLAMSAQRRRRMVSTTAKLPSVPQASAA